MKQKKKIRIICVLFFFSLSSCKTASGGKTSFRYAQGPSYDYDGVAFYDDSYFSHDSTTYDSSLATCSLSFAMASFASNNKENETHRYQNGEAFLSKCGFSEIDVNKYYKMKSTTDSLGVIFASKKIGDVTLVAAGIRGGNYEMEWASNLTVGDGVTIKQHQGFYEASTIYLESLEEYILNHAITGEIKLWTVGYSRGGATNNLSIGRIDQKIAKNEPLFQGKASLKKENIYCYCFETPMGASFEEEISPRSEIYSNIFNIINSNDPVPKVAMKQLSFTRYGIDYFLPDSIRNVSFSKMLPKVKEFYSAMDNHSSIGDYLISNFKMSGSYQEDEEEVLLSYKKARLNYPSGLFLDEFLADLTLLGVQSRENYVEHFQIGLRNLLNIVYKNGAPKFSLMTLGVSFTKYLLNSSNVDILINNLLHDPMSFVNEFIVLTNRVLKDLGMDINANELRNGLLSLIGALASTFFSNLSYFFTLVSSDNIKAIISGHYPELCLAHLMAQDKNYNPNPISYNSDGAYYYLEVHDITESSYIQVKDEKENLEFTISNQKIKNRSSLPMGSNSDTFFLYLPVEQSYTIEIKNASSYSLSYFDQRKENLTLYDEKDIVEDQEVNLKTETYPEKK